MESGFYTIWSAYIKGRKNIPQILYIRRQGVHTSEGVFALAPPLFTHFCRMLQSNVGAGFGGAHP